MKIPFAIYEVLPYFYIILGVASWLGIDEILGRLSGVLLFSTGAIILKRRIQYRKRSMASPVAWSKYY
jgi:hypothetical protein